MKSRHELTGVVRSITYPGAGSPPQVRIGVDVGDQIVNLVFLSRAHLACIDIGSRLTARGALTAYRGAPTIFNPSYDIQDSDD